MLTVGVLQLIERGLSSLERIAKALERIEQAYPKDN